MPWDATAAFVRRTLADAERAFGPDADPALLCAYAREAALDVWLATPGVTVAAADQLRRRVEDSVAGRATAAAAVPFPSAERVTAA